MAADSQYNDSVRAGNPEQNKDTWRSIGEVIAREVAPEVARRVSEKQVEGGE